jgi:hypothetical protein
VITVLARGIGAGVAIRIQDADPRAFVDQTLRDRAPDPAAPTRHENYCVGEPHAGSLHETHRPDQPMSTPSPGQVDWG